MTMQPPFDPEAKLHALGLELPTPAKPVAAYVPFRRTGNLLFISGQIPMSAGQLIAKGAVPSQVSIETAVAAARQCALNALAVVKMAVGDLAQVRQIIRLGCFVCSDVGFTEQPKVANGASDLLVQVFGDRGQHARAAVGSIALPLGAAVEVEMIVEVES